MDYSYSSYSIFLALIDVVGVLLGIVLCVSVIRLSRKVVDISRIVSNTTIAGIILLIFGFLSSLMILRFRLIQIADIHNFFIAIGMVLFVVASADLSQLVSNLKKSNDKLTKQTGELELSVAKMTAIINSMGEGVFVTDEKGMIILLNKQAELIIGRSMKDVVGKTPSQAIPLFRAGRLVPNEERPTTMVYKKKVAESHPSATSKFSIERKDGSRVPVAFTVTPILLNGVVGAVTVFRDITEEKRIDRAKSEFVSLASHQLLTPLTTISWYAEMLLHGDLGTLPQETKKHVQQIYTSDRRMIELVKALLNVSRIDMGTLMIDPKPTDLTATARACISDLEPQVLAKSLHLETDFASAKTTLNVDPQLFRIVIQNLLTNAIKYTPPHGHVSCRIEKGTKDILIIVSDDGYGIPKEDQPKIFKRLFRASNIIDKETDGTGLGLYIAKAVVEQSGGKIWFESEEGKGSTFFVNLPLTGMQKQTGIKTLMPE